MKRLLSLALAAFAALAPLSAKTLVVYYSFTNHTHTIVTDLLTQLTDADAVRIEPAEEGLDYAANGYELGSRLIAAIRENPDDAASYPAIRPVTVDFSRYDEVIVAVPLWWSNMAAPMQTFLFHNGAAMAGKRVGLIVSSASSGISGVEADARRLIPEGDFVTPSLWIRSSQTADCHRLTAAWLEATGLGAVAAAISSPAAPGGVSVSYAAGRLSVDGDFDRLCLYDLSGKLCIATSEPTVGVAALPAGVYLARLSCGKGESVSKVVIE